MRHKVSQVSRLEESVMRRGAGLRSRPQVLRKSSWNMKSKVREERRRVLRISVSKLKLIEDPDTYLRQSVLIHNTLKRLQGQVREEKGLWKKTSWHKPDNQGIEPPGTEDPEEPQPPSDVEDVECDVNEVLSQMYVPSTPALLGTIDSDDSDEESGEPTPKLDNSPLATMVDKVLFPFNREQDEEVNPDSVNKLQSCGQTYSCTALQSVVLHSLIVSLES